MSLSWLVCDLGGCFEAGQVYVALSRATSIGGLQILNFDEQRVKASEPAKRFHMAASRASERRSTSSMEALWANELLWWTPVVNTFNANERWLKLYEDNIDAWQFERWVSKYPVPPNHRSALMVAALEGGKA